jgi:hypothetical protein
MCPQFNAALDSRLCSQSLAAIDVCRAVESSVCADKPYLSDRDGTRRAAACVSFAESHQMTYRKFSTAAHSPLISVATSILPTAGQIGPRQWSMELVYLRTD